MIRLFYIILIFFALNICAYSQKFNVSEIDATNYPTVRANFSAFNAFGEYYKNLNVSDFIVNENGLDLDPQLVKLNCTESLPTNVVLVLDRSSSMNEEYNGEALWKWVVEGATTFIENFPFSDSARIAIVAFAGDARLTCNFSNDKNELLDSIKKIPDAYGSTNYNAPLLDDIKGAIALLKTRPSYHRRAVVFLTDGNHESGEPLRDKEILLRLTENNIRFYGITLMVGISKDLEFWASQTAGKYSFISSKIGLNNIYKTFAEDLKGTIQCQLEWQSPDICDLSELYRKVSIKFLVLGENVVREYVAPISRKVEVVSDKSVYIFGDPPLNQSSDMFVTITPKVSPINVSKISIIPPDYFEIIDWGFGEGVKPNYSYMMPVDKSVKLKVRFTPKNLKKLRQAVLLIDGTPCPMEVPLLGGYMQVLLDEPTDVLFSYCDSLDIVWSGVTPNTVVDLFYSIDGGGKWNVIQSRVSGLKYKWFPGFTAKKLKIKVKISEQFSYDFINSHGGPGLDVATSVNASKNGNYHYVSGYFGGKLDIGAYSFTTTGKEDFFVAKFDIEGNALWVKTGGSVGYDDRANGVTTDVRGNTYLTGSTYQGFRIDIFQPTFEFPNSKYMFLSKFSPSGQYNNSFFLGASSMYPDLEIEGLKIKTITQLGVQNKIAVIGKYKGYYYNTSLKATLPLRMTDTTFTAIFDEYLNLLDLQVGITNNIGFSDTIFVDLLTGTKYEIGNFLGTRNIQAKPLTSKGLSDFWVYRYAKNPVSEDISEYIEIVRPEAAFSNNVYNFGPVVYGQEVTQKATALLVNTGKLPYIITSYTIKDIAGKDMTDFQVSTPIVGMKIEPGESVDLDLWFKPGYLDLRQATLTIYGDCALDITLDLKGNGSCGGITPEFHDLGNVNLNKQKYDTLVCVFKNLSQTSTVIRPQIRGTHWNDFFLILPDYVKAKEVNGKITVAPDECIDLIIRFEPKSLGLREAEINFFVEAPCKPASTKLLGTGISSDIGVTSYDWGERRVRGTYNAEIEIINNSNAIEVVDNIQFENGTSSGIFNFENKTLPFNVPANGKVKINVTFTPQQEITYAENILIFVESRSEPLISNLTGIGILPKLVTTWNCGESVKVGETAVGSVTLTNPSQSSQLIIKSIEIDKDDEFAFPPGTNLTNITLDKEGFVTLPVWFTPISGGDNSDNFIILADDYDGTFTQEWKTTTVPIVCDGLEVLYPKNIDFGSMIVCQDKSLPITFENKSKDTDISLLLSQMFLSDGDAKQFEVPTLSDVVLKGGKTYTFDVKFAPKIKGDFNIVLNIPNSMGSTYKISLKGTSKGIILNTDKNEVSLIIGAKFTFAMFAELPQTSAGSIKNLQIKFDADPSVIGVVKNSFKTKITSNWNWGNLDYLGNGHYQISGSGDLADNQKIELFNLEFMTYLNDKNRTQILSEIDYGCMSDFYEMTIVNTEEVCFNDNRIIEINSNAKFGITLPNPNPANQSINFSYGIGFDVVTKIELVNYAGETIKTIFDGVHKSGEYQVNIPANEISAGTYFLRMYSCPFSATRQVILIK
jgi:hypothetical protein